ncbi:hypothetical protein I2483_17310 [Sporosarcina sp. E16_3]|uniref:hypothetical protein n=1 Tax=Sporosarcina sp. E16_3 TaxID=2789293 RepID=UPI001A920E3E|nr:hypothetical protein [Sporosarcina sp. E16_3]MBO0603427.1 hypothetical protein [Sporosarcina sp. E16_3]
MILFGLFLLVLSSLLGVYMYALFYKSRYRISDSLSYTVTLAAGQITSFVIAMTLYLVFPIDFTVICTVNLWIGIVIGTQFSSVTRKQSLLAGFFNGGVAAVMGTMVGAVTIDPTLCGLPESTLTLQNTGIAVGIFGLLLLCATTLLVRFSLIKH